jgi:hypothetical protein
MEPGGHIISMKTGNTTPICHIDIQKQNNKVKVIKLGFDFDYNPVCFLAASSGLERKRPSKFVSDDQLAWSEDDLAQYRGIHERSPLDTLAWSKWKKGTVLPLALHPGLWAFKGDRVDGLDVQLGDYSSKEMFSVRMARGRFGDKLVWNVYFTHTSSGKRGLLGDLLK